MSKQKEGSTKFLMKIDTTKVDNWFTNVNKEPNQMAENAEVQVTSSSSLDTLST